MNKIEKLRNERDAARERLCLLAGCYSNGKKNIHTEQCIQYKKRK